MTNEIKVKSYWQYFRALALDTPNPSWKALVVVFGICISGVIGLFALSTIVPGFIGSMAVFFSPGILLFVYAVVTFFMEIKEVRDREIKRNAERAEQNRKNGEN